MNSLQYKDLLINFTTEFVPVWNDKGTRAEKPVTFWRPSTSSDALGNFVPLGDVAVAGYHNINQLNIVAVVSEVDRENGTALRPPVDFERAYVDQLIWSDQGSGAHRDFSAWGVSPSQAAPGQAYLARGTFTGAEGYAKPTRQSPVHALRLDLALHSEDLPPLSPEMAPGRTMPEQVTEGIHVCELPWFTVNDPTLTPLEKLQTCPVYRLKRIDQYSLVASGQNTTPASQTFSWVFAKGEISDFSMGLRSLTGVDIKAAWAPRHPLSISANLNRDFTHTGLTAQGWEREGVADVMAYIPANKSIAAYLVKSRYELLRADGSQLGPTLTYASGDNVYFSELLQPEAAVTAVEEPEEVPAAVP
eukprot:gene16789-25757_t